MFSKALIFLVLLSGAAHATGTVNVTSLYDTASLIPGALIPLKIQGTLIDQGFVQNASVASDNGADCRIMPDPWVANIFLLKCAKASNATITFQVSTAAGLTVVHYGPLPIVQPSGLVAIGASGGQADTSVAQGKALFTKYSCAGCHAGSMPVGASPTAILNAMGSVSSMAFCKAR